MCPALVVNLLPDKGLPPLGTMQKAAVVSIRRGDCAWHDEA